MPKETEYKFTFGDDDDVLGSPDDDASPLPDVKVEKAAVQTDDDPEIVFEDEQPVTTAKGKDDALALEPLPDEGAQVPAAADDPRLAAMAQRLEQMERMVSGQRKVDVEGQIKAISDGLTAKMAEKEAAIVAAIEAGDSTGAAKLQVELSRLAAQEAQHTARVEQWKAQQVEAERTAQMRPAQAETGPAFAPEALQSWLTKNAWFHDQSGRYAKHQDIAKKIDEQVMADGFNPGHPKYYQELSKRLRETFKGTSPGESRKPTNTVTAPSRGASNGGGGGSNGGRVTLTADDRQMMNTLKIDTSDKKAVAAFAQAKAERLRREARESRT